jgi:hypothetical protein
VSNEDRGELFGRDAGGGEAFEGLFAGEAGVNEEAGSLGGNEGGVAGARRSQDGNFNYGDLLPIYYGLEMARGRYQMRRRVDRTGVIIGPWS